MIGGGCIFFLNEGTEDTIRVDGKTGDWEGIRKVGLENGNIENSNVDLSLVSANMDRVYLSFLVFTVEPLFNSEEGRTLRILVDSDNSTETGYFVPGMGADYMIEIFGQKAPFTNNVTILSSTLYVFDNNRDRFDWHAFSPFAPVEVAADGNTIEGQVPLFDMGIDPNAVVKVAWQTSDGSGVTDLAEIIMGLNTEDLVITEVIESLQRPEPMLSDGRLTIDGFFEDWIDISKYPDLDGNPVANLNADLEEYTVVNEGFDFFFYLRVKGGVLEGTAIPSVQARNIPSYEGTSNQVDVVNPISDDAESVLPELNGLDTIYIFLDTYHPDSEGFEVNDSFYANKMIEITGQNGVISSSNLYNYSSSGGSNSWEWNYFRAIDSAAFGSELELETSGLGDAFRVYYHLVSWDDSEDYSDGFWVSLGNSGARTDPSWTQRNIDTSFDGATSVYAIDIDGDGDLDVLGAADTANDITWWENTNGAGTSWTEHTIEGSFNSARDVYAIDLDDDGDVDVLGAGANDITWWENDGSESFTEHTIDADFSSAYAIYAIDLDDDGDIDVLGAANGNDVDYDVTWWENDGSESFTSHTIDSTFDKARDVYAIDLDDDGDIDVLGASYGDNDIKWWENDGSESFTQHAIDTSFSNANSVYAKDIDNDGDVDVLGMARGDDDVTWWENDGSESFTEHTIDGTFDHAYSVYATDIDNDGDVDVLGSARRDDDVTWWENDGSESFTENTIDGNFDGAETIFAADIGGDGDMDILGASNEDDDIVWWENTATFSFDPTWSSANIATSADRAMDVYVADMDNDGDLDIVSASYKDDTIAWYENDGASNPSWTASNIATSANGAESVFVADMDNDGDMDIVSASWIDDTIAWYENNAGIPEFSNIMMPIVSVLAIVGFNYRRRKTL